MTLERAPTSPAMTSTSAPRRRARAAMSPATCGWCSTWRSDEKQRRIRQRLRLAFFCSRRAQSHTIQAMQRVFMPCVLALTLGAGACGRGHGELAPPTYEDDPAARAALVAAAMDGYRAGFLLTWNGRRIGEA